MVADNPLFLAMDVAEWIDYNRDKDGSYNVSAMLRTVDEDEKVKMFCNLTNMINNSKSCDSTTYTGANRLFLTEDGLYEVLIQSRKPIARQFKKRVKQILKFIRRTGKYESSLLSETVKAKTIATTWIIETLNLNDTIPISLESCLTCLM